MNLNFQFCNHRVILLNIYVWQYRPLNRWHKKLELYLRIMTRRPVGIDEEEQVNTIPDSDTSLNLDLFAHSIERRWHERLCLLILTALHRVIIFGRRLNA